MKNKNTFYYEKNIIIGWEKITFVPEVGDKFYVNEDKFTAVKLFAEYVKDDFGKEVFVTDDFNAEAADGNGWKRCYPVEFAGKEYGMVGCRVDGAGLFFLYKME